MAGGRRANALFKIRLYILVTVSAEMRGRETREEKGFIKQPGKLSKTDSYTDKSRMLEVFIFKGKVGKRRQSVREKAAGVDRGY